MEQDSDGVPINRSKQINDGSISSEFSVNKSGLNKTMEPDSDGMLTKRQKHIEDTSISSEKPPENRGDKSEESWSAILHEVTLPYLMAGLGMVGAGLVLDRVQHWPVFVNMPELFIMVPALIGLKGNLEMTLASRLSTQANTGQLDTRNQVFELGAANLALTQVQGVVVGGLSSLLALLLTGQSDLSTILVLTTSSVVTASLASLLLGIVMVLVIAVSRQYSVNPDNVATPIAAALGDLVTLAILAITASLLTPTISLALLIIYTLLITPVSLSLARSNSSTSIILSTGWTPVLAAMFISSMGGKILNKVISKFPDIAVFQPVINGVAGNLVSIQASRLSTSLHQSSTPLGTLPSNPPALLTSTFSSSIAAQVLLSLVVPGHIIFIMAICLSQGLRILSLTFILLYLLTALFQVGLLLQLCHFMVPTMWSKNIDPDNSAIPYLTALGDLLGGLGLAIVFHLLQ